MVGRVLSWLSGGIVGQVGKELRQARLDRLNAENTESRIEADLRIAALEAMQVERQRKLADPLLKLPLFVAEASVALYIAAIMVDSTFPMDWLTPLELPQWFQPIFHIIVVGLFGISVTERFLNRR